MRRNDVGGHESQLLSLKLSEMDSHIQGFASRFDKDGSKRVGSKKSFMDSGQEGEEGGEGKAPQGTLSPEIQRRLRLNRPEFDPAEIVTNSGWLHKKGDKRRNWTKRFFMFDAKKPYHLSYRAKPTDKRSKGDITLSDHASVTRADEMRNTKNKKVPVYHFELRAKDTLSDTMRVYEMAAESEEVMLSWIHTLNYIIGQVKAYVDLRKMKRDGLLPLDGPPQVQQSKESASSGGSDWDCSLCKAPNQAQAQICEACTTPRPGGGGGIGGGGAGGASSTSGEEKECGAWECSLCGAPNQAQAQICEACTNPSPSGGVGGGVGGGGRSTSAGKELFETGVACGEDEERGAHPSSSSSLRSGNPIVLASIRGAQTATELIATFDDIAQRVAAAQIVIGKDDVAAEVQAWRKQHTAEWTRGVMMAYGRMMQSIPSTAAVAKGGGVVASATATAGRQASAEAGRALLARGIDEADTLPPVATEVDPEAQYTRHVDPASGNAYNVNDRTSSSHWEGERGAAMESPVAAIVISPEWQRVVDPVSGIDYFYNSATGESSWTEPPT